jgi:hypothetical protein
VVADESGAFVGTVLGHQVLEAIENAERPPAVDADLTGSSAT